MRRMLTIALLFLVILPSVAAAPPPDESGALTGQIVNGTQGSQVAPGITVELVEWRGQQSGQAQSATADANGHFEFTGLPTGVDRAYQVSANYRGVQYRSDLIELPDSSPHSVDLKIYETTDDEHVFSLQQVVVITEPAETNGLLTALEIWTFRNGSDRSYVGKPASQRPVNQTVKFRLPDSAMDIALGQEMNSENVTSVPDGFFVDTPLPPGLTQLTLAYQVPYAGSSATIERPLPYDVGDFRVVAPKADWQVKSDQLGDQADLDLDGKTFRILKQGGLTRGTNVMLSFTRLPNSKRQAQLFNETTLRYAGIGAGSLILILAVAVFALRRRRADPNLVPEAADDLEDERQETLARIVGLDQAFERGEMDAEAYRQERSLERQRLLDLTRLLRKKGPS